MRPYVRDLWSNVGDHTTLSSFTSEASLLAGTNQQPVFPALFFDAPIARGLWFRANFSGVLSCTGTPTYTFTLRLGSTVAAVTDTIIGISPAITCGSGITNKRWELEVLAILRTPGQGAGNSTFSVDGWVRSPGGFASPFEYTIEPTAPDTATWTCAPLDSKAQNYLQLSATCSASSASNAITCKRGFVTTNG